MFETAVHVSSHTFHDNTVCAHPNTIRFQIVCDRGRWYVTDDNYVPVNVFVGLTHTEAFNNAMRHFNLQLRTDAAQRQQGYCSSLTEDQQAQVAKGLANNGVTVKSISGTMKVSEETVRSWIGHD